MSQDNNEIKLKVKLCKAIFSRKINIFSDCTAKLYLKSQCEESSEYADFIKDFSSGPNEYRFEEEFTFFTFDPNDFLIITLFNQDQTKLIDEIQYPINSLKLEDPPTHVIQEMIHFKRNVGKFYFDIEASKEVETTDIDLHCTYWASGRRCIKQKYYWCFTCDMTPDTGDLICEACMKKCHKGHDVQFAHFEDAFCDCDSQCNCQFNNVPNDLICTKLETDGALKNQPMFYCKQCDPSCSYLICQNCAVNHHHGHYLVYIGIVKEEVCKNQEIPPLSIFRRVLNYCYYKVKQLLNINDNKYWIYARDN